MARERRKLAAILAADVVGYSRLMGRDESGTLARLREVRSNLLHPILARHGGRVVKFTGDGALVEFASAVEALAAAIEFQQGVTEGEAERPESERLLFRVGLHLGDVIVESEDLYGDGVNVAARLEAETPPGSIVLSGDMHSAIAGRLAATFEDLGRLTLKNIERPVQAYAARWQAADWPVAVSEVMAGRPNVGAAIADLPLPDKPSIAVLPFQNMSSDPEQEYFVDGVVEDIISALSRFPWLFVIARNSSFTYKGKAIDVKQAGRELGVRYMLEGSLRRAANRLRVTVQLIDATSGAHIWSERFEGALENIFDLQDQLTEGIVGAIAPKVAEAEMARVKRRPPSNLDAYDCYLRGMACWYPTITKERMDQALSLFRRATELDPAFSSAYGLAALCYTIRKASGWAVNASEERAEAERAARAAIAYGHNDALALISGAYALAFLLHDLTTGKANADRAVALNPNLLLGWTFSGWINLRVGELELARENFSRAIRLSPLDIDIYVTFSGIAHACFFLDRHTEAVSWASKVHQRDPQNHVGLRILAAAAAYAGMAEHARQIGKQLLAIDPAFRVSRLRDYLGPYQVPDYLAKYAEGLRRAGLPE